TSAIRITVTAAAMIIFILIKDKSLLRFKINDIYLFALNGFFSVFGMSTLYLYTIENTSLSTASILLYTSPIWVIIMSAIFLHEKITWQKLVAVIFAFIGCVFVSGIGGTGNIGFFFFLIGISSGISYGLYSIIGSIALRKYNPYTLTAYSFIFAAIPSLMLALPSGIADVVIKSPNKAYAVLMIIATGIETAFLPFMLYTLGLKNVEPGKAAIMASVEPMVATITGFVVYGQKASLFGIFFIMLAVLLVNNFGIKTK
ncbi:MAG: EamA family transporter, partial [Clostridia bacterium]|nr:EamA family transporter [Clostridia bacterium]